MSLMDMGASPTTANNSTRHTLSRGSSDGGATSCRTQWTQTELTLPPVLPKELEGFLSKYCTFGDRQDAQPNQSLGCDQQNNLSTSLRRRLFEGMVEDSESEDEVNASQLPVAKKSNIGEGESNENNDDDPHHLMSSPIKNHFLSPTEVMTLTPIANKGHANAKNVSSSNFHCFIKSLYTTRYSSNSSAHLVLESDNKECSSCLNFATRRRLFSDLFSNRCHGQDVRREHHSSRQDSGVVKVLQ